MTDPKYRRLFFLSACWNWLVAAAILSSSWKISPLVEGIWQGDLLNSQLSACFIVLLGIGYYIVSRDPSKNRALVVIGVIGKFSVFCLFMIHALLGRINWDLVAPVVVDLLFAALFLDFLIRTRAAGERHQTT